MVNLIDTDVDVSHPHKYLFPYFAARRQIKRNFEILFLVGVWINFVSDFERPKVFFKVLSVR